MQIVGTFHRKNTNSLISSRTQGSPGSSIPLRTLLQPLQIAAMTGKIYAYIIILWLWCTTDLRIIIYRIVIAGDVKCYIVKNSAGVVKFDMDYELTSEEAQSVSDHYPVQFQLQGK